MVVNILYAGSILLDLNFGDYFRLMIPILVVSFGSYFILHLENTQAKLVGHDIYTNILWPLVGTESTEIILSFLYTNTPTLLAAQGEKVTLLTNTTSMFCFYSQFPNEDELLNLITTFPCLIVLLIGVTEWQLISHCVHSHQLKLLGENDMCIETQYDIKAREVSSLIPFACTYIDVNPYFMA